MKTPIHTWLVAALLLAVAPSLPLPAAEWRLTPETPPAGMTIQFELWIPDTLPADRPVRAVVCVSDYQAGTEIYEDAQWRAFCADHGFALLRHQLFKPRRPGGNPGPNWEPPAVQALVDGLTVLADQAGRPELAHAPLVHTGLSWSGRQAPSLAAALPDRTLAVVTWHTRIFTESIDELAGALTVPLLMMVAEYDRFYGPDDPIDRLLAGRERGAPWAAHYRKNVEHQTMGAYPLALAYIETMARLRLPLTPPAAGPVTLRPVDPAMGLAGFLELDEQGLLPDSPSAVRIGLPDTVDGPYHWLPTPAVARLWRTATLERPVTGFAPPVAGTPGTADSPAPVRPAGAGETAPLIRPLDGRPGQVRAVWSPDALTLSTTVADSDIAGNPEAPWAGDGLEVFIDPGFERAATVLNSQTYQLIVAPNPSNSGGPVPVWSSTPEVGSQAEAQWTRTADGYRLDLRLPAAVLGVKALHSGMTIGLNYSLNDDGKPVETYAWDKAWGGFALPRNWGAIRRTE